jgi:hypothetical protein
MRSRALLGFAVVLCALVGASATSTAAARLSEPGAQARTNETSAPKTARLDNSQAATSRGNNSRDGWYPDEPGLNPKVVGSPNFGQVFATQLNGQIYAQPLVVGHVLFVATETDWIYGLNPGTGALEWSRKIGTAFRDASLNCADLTPSLGVTSTPTVDPSTGIVYLVDQAYVSGRLGWFMHAINPATGAEMPHFPVAIKGPPVNSPKQPFSPTKEMQRPGLLFLGGVIYAAFGSHCDFAPYFGIVVGVNTRGKQTTMWSVEGSQGGAGGGIWQAGGGLVSDGPNQILVSSSNGYGGGTPDPVGHIPASSPPANLADSVIRLDVQPNGSLKATNFFSPRDDATIDHHDWDLAGSPVALPAQFSTPKYPHLVVATGKEGIVYLLDRDSLGGVGEGSGGKDLALGEYGPNGEAISTAGTWPGNGGYVYVATLADAAGGAGAIDVYKFTSSNGRPGLDLVGTSSQPALFGVSGPLITSDGTTSGSAVVWVVNAGHLQAYDPVPVNKKLTLIGNWFVGDTDAFTPPGIGNNTLYVADQAGMVYGFALKSSSKATRTDRP